MAYDGELTERLRAAIAANPALCDCSLEEKPMMGGIVFMVDGNMLGHCSRWKTGERMFMFRVGKEREAEALARPGTERLHSGARRMPGFVFVAADHCEGEALAEWVALAGAYVTTLPAK